MGPVTSLVGIAVTLIEHTVVSSQRSWLARIPGPLSHTTATAQSIFAPSDMQKAEI
jgi:hypothetical protein